MMMSIFGPFDALSAEIFGQKVNHSWVPPTSDKKQQEGVGPIISERKMAAASSPSISSTGGLNKAGEVTVPSRPQQQRFAPELDGVNCFESIFPY
ncbi:hypothetical protein P3S67_006900 [Capsicum chacoense]